MAGVIVYEDAMIEIRDEGCGQLSILCRRPLSPATPYAPIDQWQSVAYHLAWLFINERRRTETVEGEDIREALEDLQRLTDGAAFPVQEVLISMSNLWGALSR